MRHIGTMKNGLPWLLKGLQNQENSAATELFLNIVIKFGKFSLFLFLILALLQIKELEALPIYQILINKYEI